LPDASQPTITPRNAGTPSYIDLTTRKQSKELYLAFSPRGGSHRALAPRFLWILFFPLFSASLCALVFFGDPAWGLSTESLVAHDSASSCIRASN
jgi:hypothetical protein